MKKVFPTRKNFIKQTYIPMLSLSACKRFWSSFNIVSLVNLWIPLGRYSSKFCDKCKSVRFSSPLIASGISSSLFSETSRQTRLRKFPIWFGNLVSWLWSSQSSWRDGKSPMCGGSSSISLSPKSKRSNFVNLLIDSGRCFSRFSRSSNDSNCIKLKRNSLLIPWILLQTFQIYFDWNFFVVRKGNWVCVDYWMKGKSITEFHLILSSLLHSSNQWN